MHTKMTLIVSSIITFFIGISATFAATDPHPHLQPITWQGDKWEYLVEYPRDIRYIHPIRMEEVTDNAGQHGWKLLAVTSENHFYAFYFSRPLLPHKIHAHRTRLNSITQKRKIREAELQKRIDELYAKKQEYEKHLQALQKREQQDKKEEALDRAYMKKLEQELAHVHSEAQKGVLQKELASAHQLELSIEKDETTVEKETVETKKEIDKDAMLIQTYKESLNKMLAEDKN